jgi:hypothetical protein
MVVQVSGPRIRGRSLFYYVGYIVSLAQADNSINTLGLPKQSPAQPLRQAAGYNDLLHPAASLELHCPLYGSKGFCLGRGYESARIDDDYIRVLGLGGYQITGLSNFRQHPFAVHDVFGTTQGDETYPHSFSVLCHST